MSNENILFVLGAARSGTTYVAELLADLFDYGMGPEGHFVVEFGKKIEQFGDLKEKGNLRALVEAVVNASTLTIIREKWPEEQRFDITADELEKAITHESFAGVVFATFSLIAKRMGKTNIGTKNPAYATCLPMLQQMFSTNSKFINVIRDGRDVALSTMQQDWGQKSPYSCAKMWSSYIDLAENAAIDLGPERFFNLKYENLLQNPEQEIERLEEFLELKVPNHLRSDFLSNSISSDLSSNFFKWKDKMTVREQMDFESVGSEQLRRNGYETRFENPRISPGRRILFESKEFLRLAKNTLGS